MPIREITDEQLVRRALMNAIPHRLGGCYRWVAVMETFGLGSTYARELCIAHGLDPDERVEGVTCRKCEEEFSEQTADLTMPNDQK